jgi:PleD family two-component response regulator
MSDKKFKILIVDDDGDIRSMYAQVFKKNGFEVEEAVDGLNGLDRASKNIPDIIFTGIIMPRMDGFDFMNSLKKNVATSKIPIIISSHIGREEDRKKAMEMGAKDFIVKTMNTPNEIVERVKRMLNPNVYKLKISETELDGKRLIGDLGLGNELKCKSCGEGLLFSVEKINSNDKYFRTEIVCPKCGLLEK